MNPRLLVSGEWDGHYEQQGELAPQRMTLEFADGVVRVGGGDTDFMPVLAAPEAARFDGLVYFTDGHAPPPANPRRVPTLWVLTGDRPRAPRFGHVVRLPV